MKTFISFPFTATIALLGGTIILSNLAARRIPEPLLLPLEHIDSQLGGWTAVGDRELPARTIRALNPTAYLSRTYQKGTSRLELFVSFYAQQRAGESMHSPKACLPGAGWEIWRHGSALIPVNGRQVEVNKYSIQNAGNRMLMFYWYQSKDRIIANEYLGKLLLARDTVITGHTAGSIVRISLPDVPSAEKEGIAFASEVIPEVQRCIGIGRTLN